MDLIVNNVKALCRQKRLSLTDVANRMGTSPSNLLSRVKGNPTISKIQDIANALQVSNGALRNYLAEGTANDAAVITSIPDYVSAYGLDLDSYQVHARCILPASGIVDL